MRCDCCNKQLNDEEATARFVDSGEFVNMCAECRSFLPYDLPVKLRSDLRKNKDDVDYVEDPYFDLEDYDDDESWK